MTINQYIYKDGLAIPCDDLLTWGQWMEDHRHETHRTDHIGGLRLSTVFLGLDHSFGSGSNAPVLWESMIFDDENTTTEGYEFLGQRRTYKSTPDLGQWRFCYKSDAYEFHDKKLAQLQDAFDKSKSPFRFGEHNGLD